MRLSRGGQLTVTAGPQTLAPGHLGLIDGFTIPRGPAASYRVAASNSANWRMSSGEIVMLTWSWIRSNSHPPRRLRIVRQQKSLRCLCQKHWHQRKSVQPPRLEEGECLKLLRIRVPGSHLS